MLCFISNLLLTMDEHLYIRIVYALMLLVFMFCGCLRCCNLWNFSAGRMSEVYPARGEAAAAYFSVVLLFPFVLYPVGTVDTWTFVRCFWIIYVPAAASLALKKFFFRDTDCKGKIYRIVFVGVIPSVVLVFMFIFACMGGARFGSGHWIIYFVGSLGGCLGIYMIYVLCGICRKAWVGANVNPSDPDIFPRRFGMTISGVCIAGLGMAWAVFIVNTTQIHATIAVIALMAGMGILVAILHPQWKSVPEGVRTRAGLALHRGSRKNILSEARLESLEHQIRRIVESEKLYLDPDLKRDTLKERLEINHSYLSEVFTRRFGSLNRYLNLLRMEYAMRYAAEHPQVKLTEVARISGFGSMNTFYRTKKQYEKEGRDNNSCNSPDIKTL